MSTAPEAESTEPEARAKPPFLRRVRIRNYKSIAFCDVTLEPLTLLVGRNASGKSNFLDALAFITDALETNIHEATRRHGGWHSLRYRDSIDETVSFEVEVHLPDAIHQLHRPVMGTVPSAKYGFMLAAGPSDYPIVRREWFSSEGTGSGSNPHFNRTGTYDPVTRSVSYTHDFFHEEIACANAPIPRPDRLWLDSFGKFPFLILSDGFRFSGYYNFVPNAIRQLQPSTPGDLLKRDGSNLAGLIESVGEIDEDTIKRVGAYLSAIVQEIDQFNFIKYGNYETVRFWLRSVGNGKTREFDASSMSDGTLRVLASLMAAFQIHLPSGPAFVAIEEPETSLHPAAMRALVDALDEATLRTQVLLTTHSAEMLDNPTIRPENIRVVEMIDGQTVIAPVDEASVEIVRRKLDTLGGLERQNQLQPNFDDLDRQWHLSQNGQEPKP